MNENEIPSGFNLLDLGIEPDLNITPNIYTSSIETDDFFCNYCDYGEFMSLCIRLKRATPAREPLFDFIIDTEAYTKSLIEKDAKSYYLDKWFPGHVIFVLSLSSNTQPHRFANFIVTGLQVRMEATINQAELIAINKMKKDKVEQLKIARL